MKNKVLSLQNMQVKRDVAFHKRSVVSMNCKNHSATSVIFCRE
jgi:hypothetical protein